MLQNLEIYGSQIYRTRDFFACKWAYPSRDDDQKFLELLFLIYSRIEKVAFVHVF
jgi:hypothetical protein